MTHNMASSTPRMLHLFVIKGNNEQQHDEQLAIAMILNLIILSIHPVWQTQTTV